MPSVSCLDLPESDSQPVDSGPVLHFECSKPLGHCNVLTWATRYFGRSSTRGWLESTGSERARVGEEFPSWWVGRLFVTDKERGVLGE